MNNFALAHTAEGIFFGVDLDSGKCLRTPEDRVITSRVHHVVSFVLDYVHSHGLELGNGVSPYGLESSYRDFGFADAPDGRRRALQSALSEDQAFSDSFRSLRTELSERLGWVAERSDYERRLNALEGRKLCALVCFCATFSSASVGYHVLLEAKALPEQVARSWCRIYAHASQFDIDGIRRAAVLGAHVDEDVVLSVEPDDDQVDACTMCAANARYDAAMCHIARTIDPIRTFATFGKD